MTREPTLQIMRWISLYVCWLSLYAVVLGSLVLLLLVAGCATPAYVVWEPQTNTLRLIQSTQVGVHATCATLGLDTAREIGRWFADGTSTGLGTVRGCYWGPAVDPLEPVHVLVYQAGDSVAQAHEERHRAEGAWHR